MPVCTLKIILGLGLRLHGFSG